MQFIGLIFPFLKWIIIFLVNFGLFIDADPRISEAGFVYGTNMTSPSIIIPQYTEEMHVITQLVKRHGWGSYAVNSTINNLSIYALANCYDDLPHNDCVKCYIISCSRLPRCLPSVSGRVYLDGCFLRYDYYNFFNETTDAVEDRVNCSSSLGKAQELKAAAEDLIENVTKAAVDNGGYAVANLNGVYGTKRDARALIAGCYLRYSTQDFLNHPSQGTSGRGKYHNTDSNFSFNQ